jgi:hypothetical protein
MRCSVDLLCSWRKSFPYDIESPEMVSSVVVPKLFVMDPDPTMNIYFSSRIMFVNSLNSTLKDI